MQLLSNEKKDNAGCPVLIFSSDRSFISRHRKTFVALGFIPIAATTPEAALAVLRLEVIALVVVDEADGVTESRTILKRVQETQQHAPVLVVSRRDDPESRRQALALGAAGYLDHPALPDDILRAFLPGGLRVRRPVDGL